MNIAQLLRTTMAAAAVVSTLVMMPSAGAATPTASDRLSGALTGPVPGR
jgi:hypothetical protein